MIQRRGKPDEDVVHFKKTWQFPESTYRNPQPLCNYGNYHILWTENRKEVTCHKCKAKLLT